jgi:hypothetical protein
VSKPAAARSVAVYSLKGGVGKTTIAVNLAWAAAALSRRSTLLWDLDAQAASTWLLGGKSVEQEAQAVFSKDIAPSRLVRETATHGLHLLPADASLRGLDRFFFGLGKKRRLEKLLVRKPWQGATRRSAPSHPARPQPWRYPNSGALSSAGWPASPKPVDPVRRCFQAFEHGGSGPGPVASRLLDRCLPDVGQP